MKLEKKQAMMGIEKKDNLNELIQHAMQIPLKEILSDIPKNSSQGPRCLSPKTKEKLDVWSFKRKE